MFVLEISQNEHNWASIYTQVRKFVGVFVSVCPRNQSCYWFQGITSCTLIYIFVYLLIKERVIISHTCTLLHLFIIYFNDVCEMSGWYKSLKDKNHQIYSLLIQCYMDNNIVVDMLNVTIEYHVMILVWVIWKSYYKGINMDK